MSLEIATYINTLNASNPPSGDPTGQAADHLRLIKSVLKATFPDVSSVVTGTGGFVPTGGIIAYQGSVAPTGYALCDGGTYSRSDGVGSIVAPDLRDRFVVGSGLAYTLGSSGGAASVTPTITVNGYSLTTADLPIHSHTINDPAHTHAISDPSHTHPYVTTVNGVGQNAGFNSVNSATLGGFNTSASFTGISIVANVTGITINNTGSGTAHSHTASSSSVPTLPPYYALAFVMKL